MNDIVVFQNRDGLSLSGKWNFPAYPTKKAIILAHGITSNKDEEGIFIELAKLLSDNGYAVFRFDFRGHGQSMGMSIDMTIKGEIDDLDSALHEVKKYKFEKIGLLGASFGGGIAVLYASLHNEYLHCLCLWNPCLDYSDVFINLTTKWLSPHKERIKKELKAQGWTTLGSRKIAFGKKLFDEMKVIKPYKQLSKITIPTLIIHGTADSYVPYKTSEFYSHQLENGSIVLIDKAEHGFQDQPFAREKVKRESVLFFQKFL